MEIPVIWEAILREKFGEDVSLLEASFYPSRKNQLSRLRLGTDAGEREIVAKYYVWGNRLGEKAALSKASSCGLAVAKPLALVANVLFMEPLSGLQLGAGQGWDLAERLAGWVGEFHRRLTPAAAKLTFLWGDCGVYNFLCDSGRDELQGLDFEEAYFGHPESDIASLAWSLLGDRYQSGEGLGRDSLAREIEGLWQTLERGYGGGLVKERFYQELLAVAAQRGRWRVEKRHLIGSILELKPLWFGQG